MIPHGQSMKLVWMAALVLGAALHQNVAPEIPANSEVRISAASSCSQHGSSRVYLTGDNEEGVASWVLIPEPIERVEKADGLDNFILTDPPKGNLPKAAGFFSALLESSRVDVQVKLSDA